MLKEFGTKSVLELPAIGVQTAEKLAGVGVKTVYEFLTQSFQGKLNKIVLGPNQKKAVEFCAKQVGVSVDDLKAKIIAESPEFQQWEKEIIQPVKPDEKTVREDLAKAHVLPSLEEVKSNLFRNSLGVFAILIVLFVVLVLMVSL